MATQIDQIQSLYDLELALVTDLYDARARQAALQASMVEATSELTLARADLRTLSGLNPGALARLPEQIVVQPLAGELSEWLARSTEGNPLIQARSHALRAARLQVRRQEGAYLPTLALTYQWQSTNLGYENTFIQRRDNGYVGVSLNMPIFAGGANRARVSEALSQRKIAELELVQTEVDITNRTRAAYLQVQAGEARIAAGQVLAESTATAYQAMQRGFELNSVTSVDLLNALRDRFRAERNLQQARYNHIRAHLLLLRESGTLSPDDLLQVSAELNNRE